MCTSFLANGFSVYDLLKEGLEVVEKAPLCIATAI